MSNEAVRAPGQLNRHATSLFHNKATCSLDGFEIFNVQIVRAYLDVKCFFNKRHQLDCKKRVDDACFEQVILVSQARNLD